MKNPHFKLINIFTNHWPLAVIALVAIVTQGWILLTSYMATPNGIIFNDLHDAAWHLSLIEEIGKTFPPTHPGLAGIPLKNYHYLSDTILFILGKITFLSAPIIYFKVAPVIASTLFTISTYLVAKNLIKSKFLVYTATTLVLFGSNIAYLIPLFYPAKDWHANSFMLDQPFDQLTNVHTYFAFATFLFALFFFLRYQKTNQTKLGLLAGLLFGLSFGFKAYAATIALFALAGASIYQFLVSKRLSTFKYVFLPAAIVFALLYSTTITNSGTTWAPGFILDKMVEDTNKLDLTMEFTLKEQHYRLTNNLPRLIQLDVYKLIIYTIGNLGIRTIGFLFILSWALKITKLSQTQVFLAAATISSLFIPTLFQQGYNIIQFGQYALILAALTTIMSISTLQVKPKTKVAIALIILLIGIPTSIKSFYDTVTKPASSFLTHHDLQALDYLKSQTPLQSVILIHPETRHNYLIIVPALASRRAYFSSDTFAALTNTTYKDRLSAMKLFFSPQVSTSYQNKFLRDAKIDYIYLDGGFQNHLVKRESLLPISQAFTNQQVTIYKVN